MTADYKRSRINTIRKILAWLALAAAINALIATLIIYYQYPYAYYVPSPPAAPVWMDRWQVGSMLVGFVTSLISLPKWQSLVALPSVLLLFFFAVYTAD